MATEDRIRAVIATRPGGPEVLDLVSRPRPVAAEGELLVRVHAAGLNRIDVLQRQGTYPMQPDTPDVLGLELAGVVEATGPGAARFRPGDRVMALVGGGAQAELAVVPEATALAIPEALSFTEAGAFAETFFTVWYNVFQRAALTAGETLLVHGGTSGIGTTAIQLAKARGARVIVTAGSPEKCAACLSLGADGAIDYRAEDFVAAAKAMTGGRGPEVILDTVGGEYLNRNVEAAAMDGRIAQIASARPGAEINLAALRRKRLTLAGSSLRPMPLPLKARLAEDIARDVLPLLGRGAARPLVDSTFPLEKVADAHARMEAGSHVGKIVLTL